MFGLAFVLALAGGSAPFDLIDHRMFVQAIVDGKGPFSMVVDTGSSSLVVTPEVARRLGLHVKSAGYTTGAGNGRLATGLSSVADVRAGTADFGGADTLVADLSAIRRGIGLPRLDGIIGYDQFHALCMQVDMDRQRLTFSPNPPSVPKSATVTPFTLDGELPFVTASVDGVRGTFLVDTGDRSELTLFRPFTQANDFFHFATVRNVVTGYGVGGPVYADLMRTTLDAFGTSASNIRTRLSLATAGAFASAADAGSIGTGFLERFNVVYDYPDKRLISWPVKTPVASTSLLKLPEIPNAPQSPLPRHALFGAAATLKPAGVTVTFLSPGGPAAIAGLAVGDVLKSIAGNPIVTAADYYRTIHDFAGGQTVAVRYVRDGKALETSVTLGTASDERDAGVTTQYQEVVVDNSLRRTLLTLPENATGTVPAVLVVGGIGCFSVDAAANKQDAYQHLAHDLARAGIAAMRIEKSGVGDSQGPLCAHVDLDAEMRGYEAAFAALASNPSIDPARIYLFGHSIGASIAPRMALSHKVAGVIVVAAVGRDWPEYELRNTRRDLELAGETPAAVDVALSEKSQCMQRLLFEDEPEAAIERDMPSCRVHNGVYPVDPPYVRQIARLNPIEPWPQIGVPALVIYGTSDFVTELADHQRIVDVVNAAHPGTAKLVTIDGMSHLLGTAASQKAASDDYEKGTIEPYAAALSAAIVAWLTERA